MAHPFFDTLDPGYRVEATRLYYVLTKAIAPPQRIDLLYRVQGWFSGPCAYRRPMKPGKRRLRTWLWVVL